MNGFELIFRLLSDETDRAKIIAALPTIQADAELVADDIERFGANLKTLISRLSPVIDAAKKIDQ
jgi:hypothetical protein